MRFSMAVIFMFHAPYQMLKSFRLKNRIRRDVRIKSYPCVVYDSADAGFSTLQYSRISES